MPAGTDTAIALKVNDAKFNAGRQSYARAVIYVNGWNIGTWVGNVGPQDVFTIPSSFLDKAGSNTLAVALTSERDGEGPDSFTLVDGGTSLGGVPTALIEAPNYQPAKVSTQAVETTPSKGPGLSITASGAVTLDKLGDGAATTALLDFGDGSEPVPVPVSDGTFSAVHSYAKKGNYRVVATVRDAVSQAVLGTASVAVAGGSCNIHHACTSTAAARP